MRIVAAFDAPFIPPDWYTRGIRVRFGELRLSAQPRLAGIKHLNLLEQVLARAEWNDPEVVEALLFDAKDHVISATAANVFLARGGNWSPRRSTDVAWPAWRVKKYLRDIRKRKCAGSTERN